MTEHADGEDWSRLPARVALVPVARLVLTLAPLALVFVLLEAVPGRSLLLAAFVAMVANVARDLARVFVTRFRVGADRVELRTGVVTTSHLSIPRERIRGVDVTAAPLHRLVGVAVVTIGTGEQARGGASGDIRLDAIDVQHAEALRSRLLEHARRAAIGGDPALDEPIATLQWRWLPWSVVSWWTLALPAILLGSVFQLLRAAGVDPLEDADLVRRAIDALRTTSPTLLVASVVGAVLGVGTVARIATFVETWWALELRREAHGTVRLRRGLLTTRTTSLQQQRLRGFELSEPVLLRPFDVAAARVVTTGLAEGGGSATGAGSSVLGPAAPRGEVERIVAAVLETPSTPTAAVELVPHPRAALRRRLVRAALFVVVLWAVIAVVRAEPRWPAEYDVALAALGVTVSLIAVAIAVDSFRSLGHALGGGYLVARRGSLTRRTVALQCDGIIGWVGTSTWFQRRVGLMTLTATTAAGASAYAVVDVGRDEAVALADAAVPGLLTPFSRSASRSGEEGVAD